MSGLLSDGFPGSATEGDPQPAAGLAKPPLAEGEVWPMPLPPARGKGAGAEIPFGSRGGFASWAAPFSALCREDALGALSDWGSAPAFRRKRTGVCGGDTFLPGIQRQTRAGALQAPFRLRLVWFLPEALVLGIT